MSHSHDNHIHEHHTHEHHDGHSHDHRDEKGHGHTHGLVDETILRSKEGVRAVLVSFLVLFITALIQIAIFMYSNSAALLADTIHNFGDALTAIPLGLAFFLRSAKGEKMAGYFVVGLILISAIASGYHAILKFVYPETPSHLWALAFAGIIGYLGNELACVIRKRAGKKLNSPALIADGNHARVDALTSLGIVLSAALVAVGITIADPFIGLIITIMIIRIGWDSWKTIRNSTRQHLAA